MVWTLALLFFGGMFFLGGGSSLSNHVRHFPSLQMRGTMEMRPEHSFSLFDGDVSCFAEVKAALRGFLEDFRRSSIGEKVVLNIDVSKMPLYTDFFELQEIGSTLCDFEDCFQKVSLLRIASAPGIQDRLIRGIFMVLPFPVPVEVASRAERSLSLSGSQGST